MEAADTTEVRLGLAVIGSLGLAMLATHVIHAFGEDETLLTFLYGIAIPLVFSVGILVGGFWLWRERFDGEAILRVATWCLIGAAVLGAAGGLMILHEQAEGIVMGDQLYIIASQATIGTVIGFIVGLYDVRQREARSYAEALSRQLTVVNRILRHDIRNDANVIHGTAQLLADDTEAEERAETIQQHALRLVELGNHARDLEQLLRGDERELETIDIAQVLQEAVDRISGGNAKVELRAPLPDTAYVYAHPLIESAVVNVIENAIEHNDKPHPEVRIACTADGGGDEPFVEIEIADNGPGIPPDQVAVLERGFETQMEHSQGLGLWLVHWLVERSGGEVNFEENDPEGSIVRLRLPSRE